MVTELVKYKGGGEQESAVETLMSTLSTLYHVDKGLSFYKFPAIQDWYFNILAVPPVQT